MGWNIKLVAHPAHSLDLTANDLGLFASLKSGTWKESYKTSGEMVAGIPSMLIEYDGKTLEKIQQSMLTGV